MGGSNGRGGDGPPPVLLCESDRDLRLALGKLLERAGLRVLSAADAREAMARALALPPACLVLSTPFPGGEAADLLRSLRELTEGREVPAVVVAGGESGLGPPDFIPERDRLLPPTCDPRALVAAVARAAGACAGELREPSLEEEGAESVSRNRLAASSGVTRHAR